MKLFEKFNANKINTDIKDFIELHIKQENVSEQFYIDVLAHYGCKDFDTDVPTNFMLKAGDSQYLLTWHGKHFSMKRKSTL